MNLFSLLIPKADVVVLHDTDTLRQGLEKMRYHGYTALPVIAADGTFIGCVNEGDFLWHILRTGGDLKAQEQYRVADILREELNPAVKSSVTQEELLERAINQNFIPVVDDRNCFSGIVTRRKVMRAIYDEQKAEFDRLTAPQTIYITA